MHGFAPRVRDGLLKRDGVAAEVTGGGVSYLPSVRGEVLCLDIELMQGARRQPDQHFLAVVTVAPFRRVGQHPVAPLAVAERAE